MKVLRCSTEWPLRTLGRPIPNACAWLLMRSQDGLDACAETASAGSRGRVPIEEGKQGAILLHHGIVFDQACEGRLVKEYRRRYHGSELLCRVPCDERYSAKELPLCQV